MTNEMIKEVIFEGLAYTVMGMVVVFFVLILIMLVIKAMAVFSTEKPQTVPEPVPEPVAPVPEVKAKSDDTELIAVITAAIAAAMGKSTSSLVIRSYKKVSGNVWNRAGRNEALENRF